MTYEIDEFNIGRFNVGNDVPFAAGEVVVKSLLKHGKLNVSAIALDKDAKIPEHQVEAVAMALVLEGTVEFTVKGNPEVLKKDDYVVMEPNTPHSLHALEPTRILLIRDLDNAK